MPPLTQADDAPGKRRRRESDEGDQAGSAESSNDTPQSRTTRSSKRESAKRAKPAGPPKSSSRKKTSAANDTQISSAEEEDDRSDAREGAQANPAPTRESSITFTERRAARLTEKYGDLTSQESLDARAAKWTSHVYKHFKKPVLITKKDGTVTSRFICIRHPSKHVDRAPSDESTGNLNRHIKVCEPTASAETQKITEYAQGVNYSYARVRYLLAMWIARRHRPFTIVEDPEFVELLRMLYSRVEIPSRVTVSRDLKSIFDDSRERVKAKLQAVPGKIHICIDGWTSPNVISFLGVTAHWHENGQIQHIILDFIKLAKGHTGAYLAHMLMRLLREFGIVLAVTCDNASNNAKMLKEMKKTEPDFRGPDARVRCFGHVINLVVKAILAQFGQKVKSEAVGETDKDLSALDDPEDLEDEEDDTDEDRDAADAAEIDEEDSEDRPELVVTDDDIRLGRLTLQKIIKLSQKVWNSPTVRAEMSRQAQAQGKKSEVLVRAVRTRWNTVTMVLARALELRSILFDLCDMAEFNKPQGVRLRRFIVHEPDWPILEQLYELLATFLEATTAISHSSTPLVHDVIPWIDVMTKHLEDTRDNVRKLPMVRAAAHRGFKILQKYYRYTDDTPFYRIAILMHPCYKKKYFARARWPRAWVEESLRLLRTEWETQYRNVGDLGGDDSALGPSRDGALAPAAVPQGSAARAARDMLAALTGADELEEEDALEEYLEAPIRQKKTDPLKFWNNALVNGTANAALARMALDVLSIPATSMDAERAFSRGRLTVSRLRHSLSDQTVRASTVLGSWARYPELVPEGDAIELMRRKERGEGSGAAAESQASSSAIVLSSSDSD